MYKIYIFLFVYLFVNSACTKEKSTKVGVTESETLHRVEKIFYDSQKVKINLNALFNSKIEGFAMPKKRSELPKGIKVSAKGILEGKLSVSASQNSPYLLQVVGAREDGGELELNLEIFVKNAPPSAAPDSAVLDTNKTLLIDVLSNDKDLDGDKLTITRVPTTTEHGEVRVVDSKVEYRRVDNFIGEESFRYTLKDSDGAESNATVTVSSKRAYSVPIIYLSQDHWDRDNYSLISAAKKMHQRGLIELRAVDVTGQDLDGKANNIFRALLGADVDIPVLINHTFTGRVTPTTRRFPRLDRFVRGILLDTAIDDSSEYLLADLFNISKERSVVYIVGGHLHNFASLLEADANLVNEKVDKIVISSAWSDRRSGEPEMNLSEGVTKPTSASKAAHIVFNRFKGEIIMAHDPAVPTPLLDTTKIDHTTALWYLIENGKYNNGALHIGDFEALLYGAVEDSWYGNHWVDKKSAKCSLTSYGAVKLSGSGVACSYLDNMNSYYTKAVLEELLYRKD
jgi:hypothetical protein